MDKREAIGIRDLSFELTTVGDLVKRGVLERPIDGNHGEIHPKSADFVAEGVPFVMASDLKNGRVDYTSCAFITERQADSLRKGFAKNGDVLLTHKATIGETAIVAYDKHPYIMLTPQVTYYRVKDRAVLSNRYLKAYFDSSLFQQTLQMLAGSGSTRAYLGITEQHRLPIILPPPEKQEKIAAILATLDDLIANNQRRIALLESMAEEIYREWFVRMRFPGYETAEFLAGRPVTWRPRRLGQVLQLRYGKALPEGQRVPGPYRVYGSAGAVGTHSEALVTKPSIVVGRKGNVGSIFWVNKPFYAIDTVYYVESELPLIYLRFLLSSMNFINSDAAVPGLNREQAYANEIFLPQDSLLSRFEEVVAPLYQQAGLLEDQVECLRSTRDALLPRLISGKLRVDALDIKFPPSMQPPPEESAQGTSIKQGLVHSGA